MCVASVDNIRNDIFPQNNRPSRNWVNKILRSLLGKGLIQYKDRKGVAGSFEISFDDFLLPSGQYSDIHKNINSKALSSTYISRGVPHGEVNAQEHDDTPRLQGASHTQTTVKTPLAQGGTLLGSNTDKNNNKNTVSVSNKSVGKVLVKDFNPGSSDDYNTLEIAKYVGDSHMDWYLNLIKDKQFWALEKAFGQLKEAKDVENPGAYLNSIVQRLIIEKMKNKTGKKM